MDTAYSSIEVLNETGFESSAAHKFELTVYPNPTSDLIKFNQLPIKPGWILIYNVLGELVYRREWPNESVDVSNLQSGVYFVKLISEERIYTVELVSS
ncbi:MAG: T9SS type A sorting domain-containing protein [Flavobacteriales bacterium]|nr:T9SS type A sorting domain-containing protein [Flavobacteriales bacterium]